MDKKESPSNAKEHEANTATRREFMKVAGVGALGLAFAHPTIETLRTKNSVTTSYSLSPDRPTSHKEVPHNDDQL